MSTIVFVQNWFGFLLVCYGFPIGARACALQNLTTVRWWCVRWSLADLGGAHIVKIAMCRQIKNKKKHIYLFEENLQHDGKHTSSYVLQLLDYSGWLNKCLGPPETSFSLPTSSIHTLLTSNLFSDCCCMRLGMRATCIFIYFIFLFLWGRTVTHRSPTIHQLKPSLLKAHSTSRKLQGTLRGKIGNQEFTVNDFLLYEPPPATWAGPSQQLLVSPCGPQTLSMGSI